MDISHVVEIISLNLIEVRSCTNREKDILTISLISLFLRRKKNNKKKRIRDNVHPMLDEDCYLQNRDTKKWEIFKAFVTSVIMLMMGSGTPTAWNWSIRTAVMINSQPVLNLCRICCSSWLYVFVDPLELIQGYSNRWLMSLWDLSQLFFKHLVNPLDLGEVPVNWKLANTVTGRVRKEILVITGLSASLQHLAILWKLFWELLKNTLKTL